MFHLLKMYGRSLSYAVPWSLGWGTAYSISETNTLQDGIKATGITMGLGVIWPVSVPFLMFDAHKHFMERFRLN